MSPKNRGKFGKAKATDIPEKDEFISGIDRVMSALRPHALRLAVFFGIIAVIVVSYTTWKWFQQRELTSATEIYMRAVSLSQVPVRPAETEQPDAAKQKTERKRSKLPPDPRGYPEEYPTAADRSRAVLSALEELSSEYGSTEVARQGLLLQAEALYQLGRHDDAAARYREYIEGDGPAELVLSAREGLAYSLEAKAAAQKDAKARQAGLEQALKAFQEMQPDAKGPRRDEALYHQARVMAELGRKELARKMLEQILADHPDSTLKPDIEMRLPGLRTAAK